MNSDLILGDIIVNKINGKFVSKNNIIDIKQYINSSGIANIQFENQVDTPLNFTILYNNQVFYPDYTWNNKTLTLDFGISPKSNDQIYLVFFN